MPAFLLSYSFHGETGAFPASAHQPDDYRFEVFATRADALRKARFVTSHSAVYGLAIHELAAAMSEPEIRAWIAANPDPEIAPASEAAAPEPER